MRFACHRSPRALPAIHLPLLRPVAWAVLALCANTWAQTDLSQKDSSPRLKLSPQLQETFTPEQKKDHPTFVKGERITGRPDLETVIEGGAELRRSGTMLRADRIEYYQPDDLAKARGNVRLNRDGNVYEGTQGEVKVDAQEGYFLQPRYELIKNGGHGQASRIEGVTPGALTALLAHVKREQRKRA